ncbi:MAG TPA: HAMP domain-containing sensor histidine kinase [Phycisphaerae bacterium]|nr:HAMP domain-containing sensor histidine kinase [Phycisphaerae bacterium]
MFDDLFETSSKAGPATACTDVPAGRADALQIASATLQSALDMLGHRLRTPITICRATAEMLLSPDACGAVDYPRFARAILAQTIMLEQIIGNVLDASRLSAGGGGAFHFESCLMHELIQEVVEMVAPAVEPDVQLIVETPQDLTFYADRSALTRLLLNLLLNAARHTSAGQIHVCARTAGEHFLEVQVRDTGAGMTPQTIAETGEPFVLCTDPADSQQNYQRRLGIMLCRTIAAAHGGFITIDSTLGRGTAVLVRLRRNPVPQADTQRLELIREVA